MALGIRVVLLVALWSGLSVATLTVPRAQAQDICRIDRQINRLQRNLRNIREDQSRGIQVRCFYACGDCGNVYMSQEMSEEQIDYYRHSRAIATLIGLYARGGRCRSEIERLKTWMQTEIEATCGLWPPPLSRRDACPNDQAIERLKDQANRSYPSCNRLEEAQLQRMYPHLVAASDDVGTAQHLAYDEHLSRVLESLLALLADIPETDDCYAHLDHEADELRQLIERRVSRPQREHGCDRYPPYCTPDRARDSALQALDFSTERVVDDLVDAIRPSAWMALPGGRDITGYGGDGGCTRLCGAMKVYRRDLMARATNEKYYYQMNDSERRSYEQSHLGRIVTSNNTRDVYERASREAEQGWNGIGERTRNSVRQLLPGASSNSVLPSLPTRRYCPSGHQFPSVSGTIDRSLGDAWSANSYVNCGTRSWDQRC